MSYQLTTLNADALSNDRPEPAYLIKISDIDPAAGGTTNSDWGITNDDIFWSTRQLDSTFESGKWKSGLILRNSIGTVSQGFDPSEGGGAAFLGDINFSISNVARSNNRFDEYLFLNSFYIINREITVYVSINPGDLDNTKTIADCDIKFKGIVNSFKYNHNELKINCRSDDNQRHKNIPMRTISNENTDGGWSDYVIIDKNRDKVLPLIFGELGKFDYAKQQPRSPALGYYVDKNFPQKICYSDTQHIIYDFIQPYVFEPGFDSMYLALPTEDGSVGDPNLKEWTPSPWNMFIEFDRASTGNYAAKGTLYVVAKIPMESIISFDSGNDAKNINDYDLNTFGYVSQSLIPLNDEYGFTMFLPKWAASSETKIRKIYALCKGETIDLGSSYNNYNVRVWITDLNDPLAWESIRIEEMETPGGSFDNMSDTPSDPEWDESFTIDNAFNTLGELFTDVSGEIGRILYFWIENPSGISGALVPEMRVYEFKLRVDYTTNFSDQTFYAHVKGAQATTSDITGSAGDFIEAPDYIIHYIESVILGIASSKIDISTTSIREDWKMAKQLIERENSRDIMGNIAKQSHIIYQVGYDGKSKVKTLSPETEVTTISESNIKMSKIGNDAQTTAIIEEITTEDIYVNFSLSYDWDIAKGQYLRNIYVRNDGSIAIPNITTNITTDNGYSEDIGTIYTTACQEAIENYQINTTYELECDWIHDDDTAIYLMREIIQYFTQYKRVFEFETKTILGNFEDSGGNKIALEVGDQVKIDDDLLPSGIRNDDKFIIFDITDDYNNGKQTIKAIQLPEISEGDADGRVVRGSTRAWRGSQRAWRGSGKN